MVDFPSKVAYACKLVGLVFLFPGRGALHLPVLNCALIGACTLLLIVRGGLFGGRFATLGTSRSVGALLLLVSLFFVPFAPVLVTAENWPSLRVLYLGPLLFTGAWILTVHLLPRRRTLHLLAVMVLALIVISNGDAQRRYARDRVRLFEEDRRVLREMEAVAAEHKTGRAFALAYPRLKISTWNPHRLYIDHLDAASSNFQIEWAAAPFIRVFSELDPVTDSELATRVATRCNAREDGRKFDIFYDELADAVCLCPP